MKNEMNLAKEVIATLISKMPSVCGIVAINNYKNAYGEISSRRINVGVNLGESKARSVEMLKAFDVTNVDAEKMSNAIERAMLGRVQKEVSTDAVSLTKAIAKMIEQLEKPNRKMSEAQVNAYYYFKNVEGENIKGTKVHHENGCAYVYGVQVGKKVVHVEGVYPQDEGKLTNSGELTILKNAIEIYLNLPHKKFRMFKVEGGQIVDTNGSVLEFIPTDAEAEMI